MASVQEVQKIIHRFVRQSGEARFTMERLEDFAQKYARRFVANQPDLGLLLGEHRQQFLHKSLETLEQRGAVQIDRNDTGGIASLFYTGFFSREVQRYYLRMSDNRDMLFPDEGSFDTPVPAALLRTVDVADNLMHFIETEEREEMEQILLLRFPEGIRSMVVTVEILQGPMLPHILAKIRDYLRTDRNAGYLETKLGAIFRGREMLVHDIIETAQIRPDDALETVRSPNEFQFHFWTQLSSVIIKDYAKKGDKLDLEHAFCQAAYLLGYFSVHHKGKAQKKQQLDAAHALLLDRLQKPPFVFSIQDIHGITDDQKIPLTKKVSRDEINAWVEELLRRPSEKEISPLVTISTPESSGLMVHSAQYIPLLRRQIRAASTVLTRSVNSEMVKLLYQEATDPWLTDDAAFERHIGDLIQEDFPLLHGLAQFKTLFLVIDGQELAEENRTAALAMIDRKSAQMKPWSTLLELDRQALYRDARLQLPVWMIIPVLRGIVRLLRRMFSSEDLRRGSPHDKRKASPSKNDEDTSDSKSESSRAARQEQFRAQIEAMQKQYLSEGQTPAQRLEQLQKSWNPLIDPAAQKNLVEDVNSLCRDTIRRMRYTRSLQAPDAARIAELAQRIAGNSAFERIRRRKEFETYLQLYMLTTLRSL